ncbi:MAG: hypothetical protein OES32_03485 [Acidobacteriota bacterium]|nr:hypothetical protein [Acidobacteriota bacterium]MDH3522626.1 hypothetical protein [Acidobacteriota bacterium]
MGLFSKASGKKDPEPARYAVGAHQVTCPQCANTLFRQGKAQLNTAVMSLLDLDWANKSATTLVCSQCSHIAWFFDEPARIGPLGAP